MKKTIGTVGVIVLSMFAFETSAQQTWEAQKNPTVDSIAAKYRDKIITTPAALSTESIFPVIGRYESATNADAPSVAVSLDAQNKGLVWIEGLPQGKIKGLLAKSPATYKIPAQKTEDGKEVAEGTLIYDKELNTLSICIGKKYDAENPASVFAEAPAEEQPAVAAKTKAKKQAIPKAWVYTGTKVVTATAAAGSN